MRKGALKHINQTVSTVENSQEEMAAAREIEFLKKLKPEESSEEQEVQENGNRYADSGFAEKLENEESFISQESDVKELVNPSERMQFPTMQFV